MGRAIHISALVQVHDSTSPAEPVAVPALFANLLWSTKYVFKPWDPCSESAGYNAKLVGFMAD